MRLCKRAHFCTCLRILALFSAFLCAFSYHNGMQKSGNWRGILQECVTDTHFGGSQKGGFQKGGFGGCSPGTKTGTRVRSPKPPFYETALLSSSEMNFEEKNRRLLAIWDDNHIAHLGWVFWGPALKLSQIRADRSLLLKTRRGGEHRKGRVPRPS